MNDTSKTSDPGLNGRFAFLNRASLTRWAPIPLRLIVGYGFMQHGYAKVAKSPKHLPSSCMPSACLRLISWHGSPS